MKFLQECGYSPPSGVGNVESLSVDTKGPGTEITGPMGIFKELREMSGSPEPLAFPKRIEKLKRITRDRDKLRIGACVTAAQLVGSREIHERFRCIAMGAETIGSPVVQDMSTIGANVLWAEPTAALPPALIAYGAKVVLSTDWGKRKMALEDFFNGPGQTDAGKDEILSEIVIEKPPAHSGGGFVHSGKAKTLGLSPVHVAAFLTLESPEGPIQSARIVLGAVTRVPMRAYSAECAVTGKMPGDEVFLLAGEVASNYSRFNNADTSSAEYRKEMIKVFTSCALAMAFEEAKATKKKIDRH